MDAEQQPEIFPRRIAKVARWLGIAVGVIVAGVFWRVLAGQALVALISDERPRAAECLLSLGASIRCRTLDEARTSALGVAARGGEVDLVRRLLEKGALVDECDADGNTPLMEAAPGGSVKTVEALLEHGADVNRLNQFGGSALMQAAASGNGPIVRRLIGAGASVEAKDRAGRTALWNAAFYGGAEAIRVLLEAGADPAHKDREGVSCAQAAVQRNLPEAVAVFRGGAKDSVTGE